MVLDFGGNAAFNPYGYGAFQIKFERYETDEEYNLRIKKEEEIKECKIKQYNKLKKELGL